MSGSDKTATEIIAYNFHGDDLDLVRIPDGRAGVVLKRLCEAIPVDARGQQQRLDRLAAAGVRWATTCVVHAVASDGKIREMVVLPVDSIPMLAATIDVSRLGAEVEEETKQKLIRYQDEAAQVLNRAVRGEPEPHRRPPLAEPRAALAAAIQRAAEEGNEEDGAKLTRALSALYSGTTPQRPRRGKAAPGQMGLDLKPHAPPSASAPPATPPSSSQSTARRPLPDPLDVAKARLLEVLTKESDAGRGVSRTEAWTRARISPALRASAVDHLLAAHLIVEDEKRHLWMAAAAPPGCPGAPPPHDPHLSMTPVQLHELVGRYTFRFEAERALGVGPHVLTRYLRGERAVPAAKAAVWLAMLAVDPKAAQQGRTP